MKTSKSKPPDEKRNYSIVIQVITSLYGLLYLYFVVWSFIPTKNGNPISNNPSFDPWDSEMIWVKIQFVIFIIGFYYSWKNRLTSGFIYLFWYVGMVALSYFVTVYLQREGAAFVLGLPMLVIAILLVISGYRKRNVVS